MRAAHAALGAGHLVPLEADRPAAVAFIRQKGDHVALVVANLGNEAMTNVEISSATGVLLQGQYGPRALFGGKEAGPLQVAADGQIIRYVPLAELAPLQAYVFDLSNR